MKPPSLVYHRGLSVQDALQALVTYGDEAVVIAGGQSLVPLLNLRFARPSALVDVFPLDELRYTRRDGDLLRIGATTTLRAIERSAPGPLAGFEVVQDAVRWVGHYPIRTRATVGGSLAHADPAAELPLVAVLLDGEILLTGTQGDRLVPAAEFFQGFLTTARRPDELVLELRLPRPPGGAVFTEHARRHGDFGIVLAGVTLTGDGTACRSVRIALGGVGVVPLRFPDVERQLTGADLDDSTIGEAARAVAASLDPPADAQASAAYRRQLAAALVGRCLRDLRDRATRTANGTGE